jgi:hypothetical protein
MKNRAKSRTDAGVLVAEYAGTLSVLFILVAIPLLDCSCIGMRAFGLWFAANQAVISAAKAKTFLEPLDAAANKTGHAQSACQIANEKANQIRHMFGGIRWAESAENPAVEIVRLPIDTTALNVQPAAVFSRDHGAPLSGENSPDSTNNLYLCRVIIKGQVEPLLTLPGLNLPGISRPIDVTVQAQSHFENVSGLTM